MNLTKIFLFFWRPAVLCIFNVSGNIPVSYLFYVDVSLQLRYFVKVATAKVLLLRFATVNRQNSVANLDFERGMQCSSPKI